MKWLRTNSSREYIIGGKKIPNSLKGEYLEVTDGEYVKMAESPVLKSLVETGGVVVYSRKPSDIKVSNEELMRENEALKAQLKASKMPEKTQHVDPQVTMSEETAVAEEAPVVEKKGKKGRKNLVDEA